MTKTEIIGSIDAEELFYTALMLIRSEDYLKEVEKGRRYFTQEQMNEVLCNRESDLLNWSDIERIMNRQGWNFTKAKFRKWMQLGILPKPVSYDAYCAYYNVSIIYRINILHYFYALKKSKLEFLLLPSFME